MSVRGPRYLAKQNGEKHYMADKPCKRGHIGLRITATGTCVECKNIKERERYYSNPEATKAKTKKKYDANAETIRARRRDWYYANIEQARAEAAPRSRSWRKNNPKHHNAFTAAHKKVIKIRTPSWSDMTKIVEFYKGCPDGYHVDHVIPLRGNIVSGLHVVENLQYLPARENISKSNRYEIV